MKIFLDSDYKCHIQNDGTMREIETGFFGGKCTEYIEGYRFVPSGETWTREDGEVFRGEMIAPWKDYSSLEMAQKAYEEAQEKISDYLTRIETALGMVNNDD